MQITLLLVVKINISACILSQLQKNRVVAFHFNNNVQATVHVSLCMCASHFTSDCFSNEGQYKAGFASTLALVKRSVPTIPDPATEAEFQDHRWVWGYAYRIQCCWTSDSRVKFVKNIIRDL